MGRPIVPEDGDYRVLAGPLEDSVQDRAEDSVQDRAEDHVEDADQDEDEDADQDEDDDTVVSVFNIRAGVMVTRDQIFEQMRCHRLSYALDLLSARETRRIDNGMCSTDWRDGIPEDLTRMSFTRATLETVLNQRVLARLRAGNLPSKARDFFARVGVNLSTNVSALTSS